MSGRRGELLEALSLDKDIEKEVFKIDPTSVESAELTGEEVLQFEARSQLLKETSSAIEDISVFRDSSKSISYKTVGTRYEDFKDSEEERIGAEKLQQLVEDSLQTTYKGNSIAKDNQMFDTIARLQKLSVHSDDKENAGDKSDLNFADILMTNNAVAQKSSVLSHYDHRGTDEKMEHIEAGMVGLQAKLLAYEDELTALLDK